MTTSEQILALCKEAEDGFWSKATVGSPNECWEWQRATTRRGYGCVRIGGKWLSAHRVAYALVNGEYPSLHVLHKCDNPACINPAHLFLGTQADNMQDKKAKGRQLRGVRHNMARLSSSDVKQIRKFASMNMTDKAIALLFGVARRTITDIRNRKTWSHL